MDSLVCCVKTLTYNYLVAEIHRKGFFTVTAAWTGIAAALLKGESTLHILFNLPVPISETSTCNVTQSSAHG